MGDREHRAACAGFIRIMVLLALALLLSGVAIAQERSWHVSDFQTTVAIDERGAAVVREAEEPRAPLPGVGVCYAALSHPT